VILHLLFVIPVFGCLLYCATRAWARNSMDRKGCEQQYTGKQYRCSERSQYDLGHWHRWVPLCPV